MTDQATKRPQRPSTWWGFDQLYSRETCISFDLAVEQFSSWYEIRAAETVEVPAPERDKNAKPTMQVPRYATLSELLGYTKDVDRTDGTAPNATEQDLSASEAELLKRIETGTATAEEAARFGI